MHDEINIVWFKRDLRIVDHHPLLSAAKLGRVVPLYIVEPTYWKLPDVSRRHWCFIYDSLNELRKALAERSLTLIIRVGEVVDVLQDLRTKLGPVQIWSHEETGNAWTYDRDKRVVDWCKTENITWHETPSHGVVRGLRDRDGWSAIRNRRMQIPIEKLGDVNGVASEFETDALPSKNSAIFGDAVLGEVQEGGREAGLAVLDSFLKVRARNYMATISKPGISARNCSRLSAHIAYGTLSVREIEQATHLRISELNKLPSEDAKYLAKNLGAFLSRLAWRCHFVQKLEQQPEIEMRCMHLAFEGMREPHFRDDFFDAWKNGNTGYPLVDACMRSLHANGWINFRMRAMLVSFASYHLWLDWRQTAPFMARLFTDYEPGIHYSQFQMQSGVTGINAVRMYNPIKQSIDHDPTGKFIRRYVPELLEVSDQWIHEPWRMPQPPKGYPRPIVDHEAAIKFARAEISKHRLASGFGDDARAINRKLGSRNKQPSRQKKSLHLSSQLSFDL